MIIDLIKDVFVATGQRWKIEGVRLYPTENNIKGALDEAARLLYDKEVGTTCTVAGLHIEKTKNGHDVYAYVGDYK